MENSEISDTFMRYVVKSTKNEVRKVRENIID